MSVNIVVAILDYMYWYIDLPEKNARDTRICANFEAEIFGIFLYLMIVDSKKILVHLSKNFVKIV